MEDIQYYGGHLQYCWEITAVRVRESFKTVWEPSVLWSCSIDRISTVGDSFSIVDGIQYVGGTLSTVAQIRLRI